MELLRNLMFSTLLIQTEKCIVIILFICKKMSWGIACVSILINNKQSIRDEARQYLLNNIKLGKLNLDWFFFFEWAAYQATTSLILIKGTIIICD